MTTYQPKHNFNLRPDAIDARDHFYALVAPLSLPASVDLRPGMPAVYDQGQLGSCTANAAAAAYDYYRHQKGLAFINPSRLMNYYNERSLEGHTKSDAGASVRDSLKVLNQFGTVPETEWPYVITKYKTKPIAQCFADALANKIPGYASVPQSLLSIKTILASGTPICFGMQVYDSFESPQVAQTGVVPMPDAHGTLLGGHEILASGYNDTRQAVLVRNSWGPDWGIGGYFWLPYAYMLDFALVNSLWIIRA